MAYVGVVSLSALKSMDVKPYAALVISPRLLLNAGIAWKARYTRLCPSTSSKVSRATSAMVAAGHRCPRRRTPGVMIEAWPTWWK